MPRAEELSYFKMSPTFGQIKSVISYHQWALDLRIPLLTVNNSLIKRKKTTAFHSTQHELSKSCLRVMRWKSENQHFVK